MSLFKNIARSFLGLTLLVLLSACPISEEVKPQNRLTKEQIQDSLIKVNIELGKAEEIVIDQFVKRKKWDMKETGTGLRYLIYERGRGENLAQPEQLATISFEMSLLNGKICYRSDSLKNKDFYIEADAVESGLHEGVKYMHVGDRAKFIIPAHLAHGLLGDMDQIPPRSTIVYDVKLLRLR